MINQNFKSVRELIKAFPDEQTCITHLEQLRWNGNVISPFDATSKVYKCAGNKYKCKSTGKYFNVRTATLFDNTKIELQTWFLAIYLITGHKKGISSLQLAKDLNVTQKTAWFMLHRIRACYGLNDENTDGGGKLGGEGVMVEVDETIVGGKVKNMTKRKRKAIKEGDAERHGNKTTVMGYVERGGSLRMEILPANMMIKDALKKNVDTDSILCTDAASVYAIVGKEFTVHGVVDHRADEYKNEIFHTNTIEGAFSLFDRMVIGTYHYVSVKHMQAYINEHCFRYNTRKVNECTRFNLMLSNSANRLTYKSLIK
jgi:hypothetical protein